VTRGKRGARKVTPVSWRGCRRGGGGSGRRKATKALKKNDYQEAKRGDLLTNPKKTQFSGEARGPNSVCSVRWGKMNWVFRNKKRAVERPLGV